MSWVLIKRTSVDDSLIIHLVTHLHHPCLTSSSSPINTRWSDNRNYFVWHVVGICADPVASIAASHPRCLVLFQLVTTTHSQLHFRRRFLLMLTSSSAILSLGRLIHFVRLYHRRHHRIPLLQSSLVCSWSLPTHPSSCQLAFFCAFSHRRRRHPRHHCSRGCRRLHVRHRP